MSKLEGAELLAILDLYNNRTPQEWFWCPECDCGMEEPECSHELSPEWIAFINSQ